MKKVEEIERSLFNQQMDLAITGISLLVQSEIQKENANGFDPVEFLVSTLGAVVANSVCHFQNDEFADEVATESLKFALDNKVWIAIRENYSEEKFISEFIGRIKKEDPGF